MADLDAFTGLAEQATLFRYAIVEHYKFWSVTMSGFHPASSVSADEIWADALSHAGRARRTGKPLAARSSRAPSSMMRTEQ